MVVNRSDRTRPEAKINGMALHLPAVAFGNVRMKHNQGFDIYVSSKNAGQNRENSGK
jgi:hypothetical protein